MIQAVIFKKSIWTTNLARKFMKKKGWKPIKCVHTTKNYYRYRLANPEQFKRFRIKDVPKWSFKLVIGFD